jgi:ribonuclease P protein component
VERKYRIVRASDFKRVGGSGRSTAHPFIVMVTMAGASENSRVGIVTSKTLGNAVQRNHVRRQLRAILSSLMPKLKRNVDILIIARKAIVNAEYSEIRQAVIRLLVRENCLDEYDIE